MARKLLGGFRLAHGVQMSFEEILASIRDTMVDVFDLDELEISKNTTADDIEEWDSLSNIRLVVAVERSFKVKFTNAEIAGLMNVGDLVKLIQVKLDRR
jgi:acyl carrier protein